MPAKRIHPGFTLIELLVVIVLIITLVGIAFPTINSLVRSSKGDTAVNTVSVAAQAIRAYATQNMIGSGEATVVKGKKPPQTATVSRQGTALLFTPSGEIRLVQHNPSASASSLIDIDTGPEPDVEYNVNGLLSLRTNTTTHAVLPELHGYMDIANRDPIKLPTGIGALGIVRDTHASSGGALKLIAPPFAVRFNSYGQLVAGDRRDDTTYVYYDGDYNGQYLTNTLLDNTRPSNYDPKTYDPYYNNAVNNLFNTNKGQYKYKLPFDKIETVIGVVLYSKADMDDGVDPGNPPSIPGGSSLGANPLEATSGVLSPATQRWVFKTNTIGRFENAQVVFFNRYTGQAIREGVTGQ